jgi:hypothetical protein
MISSTLLPHTMRVAPPRQLPCVSGVLSDERAQPIHPRVVPRLANIESGEISLTPVMAYQALTWRAALPWVEMLW